jgi:hypothetical protein
MNKGRLFIFFVLSLVIVTAALSFFMPTHQTIERSITIKAPLSNIYNHLSRLENFNKISVWGQQDSLLQYSFTGTDGTAGAITRWKGNPEISGEGSITITGLEMDRKITHAIAFTKPKKGNATSTFNLVPTSNTTTDVSWVFKMATPRPMNIFNLIFSLDEQMGGDFEKGLNALKQHMEASPAATN